jgi:hypothetical protein
MKGSKVMKSSKGMPFKGPATPFKISGGGKGKGGKKMSKGGKC